MHQIWSALVGACMASSLLAGCGDGMEIPSALETGREALQGCGVLASNTSLVPGQTLTSCDGRTVLKMKENGDLVLNGNGVRLWASHTDYDPTPPTSCPPGTTPPYGDSTCQLLYGAHKGTVTTMQGDGNFVIYGDTFFCSPSNCVSGGHNVAIFASHTANHPGAFLAVQNDGNMVVYSIAGQPLWATNTHL